MNLAQNAQTILDARMRGFRPADMVLVSLTGPVWAENPIVFAKPEQKYDWRWVRGLDVGVYINGDIDWPGLVKDIALQRPDYLCVWDSNDKWGAKIYLIPQPTDIGKPVCMWKYELDFLPWMDFQNIDFLNGNNYEKERGLPCT